MEMYALTPKGVAISRSTNGSSNPTDKDYDKWQILYKLRFLHYSDKDKLVSNTGLSPASVSLAIAELKRHGYVVDTGSTSEV